MLWADYSCLVVCAGLVSSSGMTAPFANVAVVETAPTSREGMSDKTRATRPAENLEDGIIRSGQTLWIT
jgi:hypothetical protein